MSLVKLTVLLVVYVALDFSNPMMPGAVTFGADGSVEGRQADRMRDAEAVGPRLPTAMPQRLTPVQPPVMAGPRAVVDAAPVWHVQLRRAYPSSSASVASSEDH